MTITHWNHETGSDDSWNFVRLANAFLWVATVDVKITSSLDIQKPKKAKAGGIRDLGDPPKKVKIKLQMDSPEELKAFEKARPLLLARSKNGARDPIAIEHPNANFWGITAVVIDEIDSPSPDAVEGWQITIDALEWQPFPRDVKKQLKKAKDAEDADAEAWAPFVSKAIDGNSPALVGAARKNMGLDP